MSSYLPDQINDIRWWTHRIQGINHMTQTDAAAFIDRHAAYYALCQKHLYANEDPYHLTYATLPTFLFMTYLPTQIDLASWLYDTYPIRLNQLDTVLRQEVITKGYVPAMKWILSRGILPPTDSRIASYLSSACFYGHAEMVSTLYEVYDQTRQARHNHAHTEYEWYRLAASGGHPEIIRWLHTKGVPIEDRTIEYLIASVRHRTDRTEMVAFLTEWKTSLRSTT